MRVSVLIIGLLLGANMFAQKFLANAPVTRGGLLDHRQSLARWSQHQWRAQSPGMEQNYGGLPARSSQYHRPAA